MQRPESVPEYQVLPVSLRPAWVRGYAFGYQHATADSPDIDRARARTATRRGLAFGFVIGAAVALSLCTYLR